MNLTAISIVAIVCWAIVELVNGSKDKKKNKAAEQDHNHSQHLEQEMAAMRDRIETLEKIVTDEKYDLNRKFDDLKKDRVA